MRGPQVREMLEQTRDHIGDKPWGVGLLGFVPQALREEQCAEIWKCPPPFALIAGGRPDQAAEFEKRGIKTYIHAPAPALLRLYLEQGARRFVFEGRECGGHVGPIASFPMWEQMIDLLLTEVSAAEAKHVHVLFAGGIHDAFSCAMVAAMTAPLAARGMKVGVLMGTAYLFTQEIVHSGAIVQGFQDEALRCRRTVNLESGPGHASRCVDTQFAREFFDTRRRLIRDGRSAEEIRDELEDLNLGRLRIASKGVNRNAEGQIVSVAQAEQLDQGMYMIGQVATLRDAPISIEALHLDVCRGAQVHLEDWAEAHSRRRETAQPSDIAIVGIGTLMPKADGPEAFWHNVLHQVCAIGPVPPERWDPDLYFDPDTKARDKSYSRWGGFLDEVPFDPMRYGIPPRSMKSIDPMQLLTLEVAQRTLSDAGYGEGGFDRENTSIILGAGGGLGDLGLQFGVRAELPRFVENPDPRVWDRLPEWTEETFAGTLLNVAAGRVANRMDFGGLNFTVDAACASSLAAISIAVNELETGRSNMVLAGGIDTVQSAFGFICFSKTQALSPTGVPRTFDRAADGIAISEGLAVVALRRLADAERDGDRIYAVIKSVAGSSDGKALGLTAPRPDGQIRAINRAYAKAGFSPASLELFEAHGTGTPVGDKAEAETVTRALRAEQAAPNSVALGSLKTLVGHTKASAGVAGLIKVALSLHHRVQPAHFGVDNPIEALAKVDTPAYLLKQPRPWVAHPDHPRRAGVSAFGFGGTNFHAVLEEYGGHQSSTSGRTSGRMSCWCSAPPIARSCNSRSRNANPSPPHPAACVCPNWRSRWPARPKAVAMRRCHWRWSPRILPRSPPIWTASPPTWPTANPCRPAPGSISKRRRRRLKSPSCSPARARSTSTWAAKPRSILMRSARRWNMPTAASPANCRDGCRSTSCRRRPSRPRPRPSNRPRSPTPASPNPPSARCRWATWPWPPVSACSQLQPPATVTASTWRWPLRAPSAPATACNSRPCAAAPWRRPAPVQCPAPWRLCRARARPSTRSSTPSKACASPTTTRLSKASSPGRVPPSKRR